MQLNPHAEIIGKHYTKSNEGFRAERYICTGKKPTIGYGHQIFSGEIYNRDGYKISVAEADRLFDIDYAKAAVSSYYLPIFADMPDGIKIVLIDMVYQMGLGFTKKKTGVRGFKNTLRLLSKKEWSKAATELLLSKYATKDSPTRAYRNHDIIDSGGGIAAVPILRIAGLSNKENDSRIRMTQKAARDYQMESGA